MSDEDTDTQEPDAVHECPVDECEYVSQSERGALKHFGLSHDDDVMREVCLDELRQLASELGQSPRAKDMDRHGAFSQQVYVRLFGRWNAAVRAAGLSPTKKHNIPQEDLLNELRRLSDELGRTPTAEDMDTHGEYHSSTYTGAFDLWNNALETAGLKINKAATVSRDDLIGELRRLAAELGRTPCQKDMAEHGMSGPATYHSHFGSWNAALETAGLEINHTPNISRDDLVGELRRLAAELGRTPGQEDMREHGTYDYITYCRHFGSWNATLEAVGMDLNSRHNIPDKELLDELRRLYDELGRTPRMSDMLERGEYGVCTYTRRFGSWFTALEASGLEPHSPKDWVLSGEDHPFYNGGDIPYGPGWNVRKKELVRERDGRECQHCGRSEKEHVRIHGTKHTVHHIQKAKSFDDPKQRNRAENLVTLCRVAPDNGDLPCHWVWEAMSPLRPSH